jgi:hypothetical protein
MEKCLVSGVFLGDDGVVLGLVPGTISGVLYLVQYRRSVPGTISAFCAWYNIGVLCLAPEPS